MTKPPFSAILSLALFETSRHGGIAQLARACGSYPQCPRFKSRCRYQNNNGHLSDSIWRNGPVVKRLRLRPFTAATRVRVPSGSPPFSAVPYGGIAQPVERPPHTRKVTDSSSVVSTRGSPRAARLWGFSFCFFKCNSSPSIARFRGKNLRFGANLGAGILPSKP